MSTLRLAALVAVLAPTGSAQQNFAEYWPFDTGHEWVYIDSSNQSVLDTWSVHPFGSFQGQPAWPLEIVPGAFAYIGNDGTFFVWYGIDDNGAINDFADIDLSSFVDGDSFSTDPGCLTVIREWSALDHSLTAQYGLDPELCDVLVWVWYDLNPNFCPGAQNAPLESNGQAYPYAVTDIDWFQRGFGPLAHQGVHADLMGALEGARQDVAASFVVGSNYCTSMPNSSGKSAHIAAYGSPTVVDQDLTLQAHCCPPNVPGLFFFGTSQVSAPFGDGVRCAGGGVTRMYPIVRAGPSGGLPVGTALLPVDFGAPYGSAFSPGSALNFQFWYRDGAAGGAGFNLTEGLAIPFQ